MATRVVRVAPHQRMAAQALVEQLEKEGKPVPEWTRKIANAKPKVAPTAA